MAAGQGTRFEAGNKLLAQFEDQPLVIHAVESLLGADLTGVTVVVGHDADRVGAVLQEYPVRIVENQAYSSGQASSVATGLSAVRDESETDPKAVVFALADMPCVNSTTINRLITAYHAGVGNPLAAAFNGQRGNPVLFGNEYFDALERVSGDVGGRNVFRRSVDAALVDAGDPGVLLDVDTDEDLRQLRE